MKQSTRTIISIVVPVIVGIGAFFGGAAYGKHTMTANRMNSFANGQRGQFTGSRTMMNNAVAGKILSKDDKSLTIQLAAGGSRIVLLSPSTPVLKSTTGTQDDLKVGSQVFATGTSNADGSITAQSVTLGTPIGPRTQPQGR